MTYILSSISPSEPRYCPGGRDKLHGVPRMPSLSSFLLPEGHWLSQASQRDPWTPTYAHVYTRAQSPLHISSEKPVGDATDHQPFHPIEPKDSGCIRRLALPRILKIPITPKSSQIHTSVPWELRYPNSKTAKDQSSSPHELLRKKNPPER